jgi:hypothetical protein
MQEAWHARELNPSPNNPSEAKGGWSEHSGIIRICRGRRPDGRDRQDGR